MNVPVAEAIVLTLLRPVRRIRAMLRPLCFATLLASVLLATPEPASAQHPVCPPVARGEVLLTSCRSWSSDAALRLLDDFTVDHLFKAPLPAFERTWTQLATVFASTSLPENADFRRTAKMLEPLRFTPLDRTTGTVGCDLSASPRRLELDSLAYGNAVSLQFDLPEVLEGGYWRGPDVLQMTFWKRNRPTIRVSRDAVAVAQGEIQCFSLSADGLLVRFSDTGSAPVFVSIRDCTQ